jgi:hypothetical protein
MGEADDRDEETDRKVAELTGLLQGWEIEEAWA